MNLSTVSQSKFIEAGLTRFGTAVVAFLIVAWFLWFAGSGLFADFTEDDVMNLHYYWKQPPSTTVMANLCPFTSYYRPLGAAFYLPLYYVFGLDPLPFRIVCFGLILFNLYLLFQFARHLTGRVELAIIAAFLASYHAWFVDIYYSSGTIYDLLCFAGYFLALNRYLSVRQAGAALRKTDWLIVALGYFISLNAKELAVSLPLALAIYELAFHIPQRQRLKSWFSATVFPISALGLATIFYCWVKLSSGLLATHSLYKPQIGMDVYLDSFHIYLNPFLYQDHYFRDNNTAQMMGVILILCLILRRRDLLYSWFFALFSVLPFIFIPHYAGFFWYLPMAGWSVLGAGLVMIVRDAGVALVRRVIPESNLRLEQVRNYFTALVVVPLIILLAVQHSHVSTKTFTHFMSAQAPVSALVKSLEENRQRVSHLKQIQVILLDDPYRPDFHTPVLLAQIFLDAPSIRVLRISGADFEVMEVPETVSLILRFDGTGFEVEDP